MVANIHVRVHVCEGKETVFVHVTSSQSAADSCSQGGG